MRSTKSIFQKFSHKFFHRSLSIMFLGFSMLLCAEMSGGKAAIAENLSMGLTDELTNDKNCDGTGGLLAYAETKDYALYVCADLKDISQPRYYRSVNKNGTQGVKLTAKTYNPNQGTYFEFHNGDYVYLLQLPSENIKNPVLIVEFPDSNGYEQKITRLLLSDLLSGKARSPISTNK